MWHIKMQDKCTNCRLQGGTVDGKRYQGKPTRQWLDGIKQRYWVEYLQWKKTEEITGHAAQENNHQLTQNPKENGQWISESVKGFLRGSTPKSAISYTFYRTTLTTVLHYRADCDIDLTVTFIESRLSVSCLNVIKINVRQ